MLVESPDYRFSAIVLQQGGHGIRSLHLGDAKDLGGPIGRAALLEHRLVLAHAYRVAYFEFRRTRDFYRIIYPVARTLSATVGVTSVGRMPIVRCL